MPKRNQQDKSGLIAGAYLLSFPQLFVWALIFAFIGALTMYSGFALTHNSNGSSLSLRMVQDANNDGAPNYGDVVTFNVTTTQAYPWVTVNCSQNGNSVYSQTAGFFPSYQFPKTYTLGPTQSWSGGAASCNATMFTVSSNGRDKNIATLNFSVNP